MQIKHKLGPSWAQVGPKLALVRKAKDGQFYPSRVWVGQARPLLSSLSGSLGGDCSRREATRICANMRVNYDVGYALQYVVLLYHLSMLFSSPP